MRKFVEDKELTGFQTMVIKKGKTIHYDIFGYDNIEEKKPIEKKPTPPFTTSTLQQEASRKLGFSVSRTMSAAQKLYEQGHITYMRTDSVNLSNQAIKAIKETINNKFGEKYFSQRIFKDKTKNAQQAHEAVRPTDFSKDNLLLDADTTVKSELNLLISFFRTITFFKIFCLLKSPYIIFDTKFSSFKIIFAFEL